MGRIRGGNTEYVHDQQDSWRLPEPTRHWAGVDGGGMRLRMVQAAAKWNWTVNGGTLLAVALEHADDVSVDRGCA